MNFDPNHDALKRRIFFNSAFDIEFCHAYSVNHVVTDMNAKINTNFLQIVSNETITRIEYVRTHGTVDDFALDIKTVYTLTILQEYVRIGGQSV